MTVNELIEKLKTISDMDAEVLVNDFETVIDVSFDGGFLFIHSAEDKQIII